MSYFVANTATDKNYKELLTGVDYAETLAKEHFTDAGKPDENNTWTIKNIGKLKDGETIESNNYIVFVKAKDNIGNVRIYGSNGIVLENLHDISVTYTESADGTVNRNTWTDGIVLGHWKLCFIRPYLILIVPIILCDRLFRIQTLMEIFRIRVKIIQRFL